MSRTRDGQLHWTSHDLGWRAWATELYPDDPMPPYYQLTKVATNQAVRTIALFRPRGKYGDKRAEIGIAGNLAEAKAKAQEDYERRQVREHLKQI